MTKNAIGNKSHLKEILARNPELLEKGLKLVDTDIEIFAGDQADMLAVDKEKRLVVLAFSAEPQSLRTNKGVHLLKEAFHNWNWLMYFKDALFEGSKKKTSIKPAVAPPRLAVIAPSFTKGLISTAKMAARSYIDLELYTYNKTNFKTDGRPFQPVSLKTKLPPAALPDSIGSYHAWKIDYYWSHYGGEFTEARYGKGYTAYSLEDILKAVGEEFVKRFQKIHQDIMRLELGLRPVFLRDTVIYKDIYGNEVCSLSVHELQGFSLLVGEKLFYWGEKPGKDGGEEKTALATIKSYGDAVKKEVEKTF